MQINIDCFKDVLKYCIDNIDYEEDGNSWNIKCVNLSMMYESPDLKYEKKGYYAFCVEIRRVWFY